MRISVKNILICVGIIILTYMAYDLVLKILKYNYIMNLIDQESARPLEDYDVYNDLAYVLKKYVRCLSNREYSKLRDMSLYKAELSDEKYKELGDKLVISSLFEIAFDDISVLDEHDKIYLCDFKIKNTNSYSDKVKIAIKLDREKGFFRVLNIRVGEV